jgi:hypothetical protein
MSVSLDTFEVGDGCRQQALEHAELEGVANAVATMHVATVAAACDVGPERVRQLHRVRLPPAPCKSIVI